jgi:hypothetical protein
MLNWFQKYSSEISMFISGWCAFATLDCLIKGQYGWAAFNAVLSYANARFSNR